MAIDDSEDKYDVVLLNRGPNTISVIRCIIGLTNKSVEEARRMVVNQGQVILSGIPLAEAIEAKTKLSLEGAAVDVQINRQTSIKSNKGAVEVVGSDLIPEVLESKTFPVEKIPGAVTDCIVKLSALQKKVDAAYDACVSSQADAQNAASVKLGFWRIGDKSKAIEAMQTAVKNMAGSMVDQSDAMKAMFNYQSAISKAMQFLLGIGVSGLAANRVVYQSLQAELRGASTEKLSELARKELEKTIEQLKTQQDLLVQQEKTKEAVKRNRSAISDNKTAIEGIIRQDQEQEKELKRQRDKDDEHDKRLNSLQKQIKELKMELEASKRSMGHLKDGKGWFRSSDENIVAGVCAGLACRMAVSPWSLRVGFIILSFLTLGVSILGYVILMMILKPMPTK